MQPHQLLPDSDAELMAMRRLCGNDNTRTAAVYGCNESQVRKRVRRVEGPSPRRYVRLPKPVGELYAEWVATGTGIGSQAALARSYGLLPTTLRRAFNAYRRAKTEEEVRREQEEDREALE